MTLWRYQDGRKEGNAVMVQNKYDRYCLVPASSMTANAVKQKIRFMKCSPSFVIIGAMKSGTGELMKWLNLHPQCISGRGIGAYKEEAENEMHFFTEHYVDTESVTANRFAYVDMFSNMIPRAGSTLGEALSSPIQSFDKSPDYIRSTEGLQRMSKILKTGVKLIILLRNPVQRLISGFLHNCRHHRYVRLNSPLFYVPTGTSSDYSQQQVAVKLQSSLWPNISRDSVRIPPNAVVNIESFYLSSSRTIEGISSPTASCTTVDFRNYLFGATGNTLSGP